MTDPSQRVDRMDAQAMALVDALQEFLVGRPVDVIVDALATAAARAVAREAGFSEEEVIDEVLSANELVQEVLRRAVEPTRRERLRFALHSLQIAAIASAAINMENPGE